MDVHMALPHIIFAECHHDPIVWLIIKKMTPKLAELGYKVFFSEAPEGMTLNQFSFHQKIYADFLASNSIYWAKDRADKKEHSDKKDQSYYTDARWMQILGRYSNIISSIECYENLPVHNVEYQAIDAKEIADEHRQEYFTSDAGMKERDRKMSRALLDAPSLVFEAVGFQHIEGIQHELLAELPLQQASSKFYFFYIFSNPGINDYEDKLRNGKIDLPLGLTVFNANDMTEEKIIGSILDTISLSSDSLITDARPELQLSDTTFQSALDAPEHPVVSLGNFPGVSEVDISPTGEDVSTVITQTLDKKNTCNTINPNRFFTAQSQQTGDRLPKASILTKSDIDLHQYALARLGRPSAW